MNLFEKLAAINVNDHVEKKAGLTYLSWAWAVDQLMRQDPSANWTIHNPTVYPDGTMMVSCTVTAFDKPVYMWLPVMDHRNKAIQNPNAFDINKNQMRCLVKAISCHGLGLYIYAGEDLPEGAESPLLTPAREAALGGMPALTAWHKANAKADGFAEFWKQHGAELKDCASKIVVVETKKEAA